MALTKVKGSGLATGAATDSLVGIDDNATSTAITIDASENVTLANSAILKVKDAFGDTAMQFNVLSSGSNSGRISVDPDNTGASSQLSVYVDASEKLTVLSTGDVNVKTGNLVIGTSGKGIDFSAVSDGSRSVSSNILDDYEEGTWTPIITDGTNVDDATYSVRVGTYTKIGNKVHLQGRVTLTSLGSVAGAGIYLSGFPFNTDSLSSNYSSINIGYAVGMAITAGTAVTGFVLFNSYKTELRVWDHSAGNTSMSVAEFSATGSIMFNIEYTT